MVQGVGCVLGGVGEEDLRFERVGSDCIGIGIVFRVDLRADSVCEGIGDCYVSF